MPNPSSNVALTLDITHLSVQETLRLAQRAGSQPVSIRRAGLYQLEARDASCSVLLSPRTGHDAA